MQVVMHVDIKFLMRILRPLSINACIGCCYKDRGYGTLAGTFIGLPIFFNMHGQL